MSAQCIFRFTLRGLNIATPEPGPQQAGTLKPDSAAERRTAGLASPPRPRGLQRLRHPAVRLQEQRDAETLPCPAFPAPRCLSPSPFCTETSALSRAETIWSPVMPCYRRPQARTSELGTAAGLGRQHSRAGCSAPRPGKSQTAAPVRPHRG